MKKNKIILLLILIFIFLPTDVVFGKKPQFPFLIIQMTDPQFGFIENNKDFTKETLLYEKAIEKINSINPAFVVITGDFVNDRSNAGQWNEFDRITGQINKTIHVWLLPGNHDIGRSPSNEDIDQYVSRYGYDRFSFRHKKCLCIGLNTCIIKSGNNELEQRQFEWLEKKLKSGKNDRHIILFGHYPFFIKSPDEPETYSNIKPELRKKYLDLFNQYNVSAVFSGHLHDNAESVSGNTKMVVTSAVGKPLGDAPSGLRIIKVYKDRIEHEYYPLDLIPDQVYD